MRKLMFLALFLGSAGLVSAQTGKKAKSPKKIVRTTAASKTTVATPAPQARTNSTAKPPAAAASLFEATKSERKQK